MPWGLTRFHHSGQSHFVTYCCYHRPIRLLRCAQSLRAGSVCLPPTKAADSSSQPWSACGATSEFKFTGTSASVGTDAFVRPAERSDADISAIAYSSTVTVAPVTSTTRGHAMSLCTREVVLNEEDGMKSPSAVGIILGQRDVHQFRADCFRSCSTHLSS